MSVRKPILVLIAAALLVAIAILAASCGTTPTTPYKGVKEADFSKLSWTEAFKKLNDKISSEYAFTDWKSIDWKALYSKYSPQVQKAQAARDARAFEVALRQYVLSVPDGHVNVRGGDPAVADSFVGGGFGLAVAQLDNGSVVAIWVKEGGPAAAAGIKAGAHIVKWDGKPVAQAVAATPMIWDRHGMATTEDQLQSRLRYVVRAAPGAQKSVTFRDQGSTADKTATLTALADGGESYAHNYPDTILPADSNTDFTFTRPQSMVNPRMLEGNIGYMRILAEIDLPEGAPGNPVPTLQQFQTALKDFTDKGARGVIIDVRNNNGGSDEMVTAMLGSFYRQKTFYEYINFFNPATGKWEIWQATAKGGQVVYVNPGQGYFIEPISPRFTLPVVAIVNNSCISSGEGVAMGIKNAPNTRVTGFYGTNGSFGDAGDTTQMPANLTVSFPFGQSLDKDKIVQVDSKGGKGGIAPNDRLPMTLENALKVAAGQDVELEHAMSLVLKLSGQSEK